MRIIGGHDYYDSSLAYGQDSSIVFIRHKEKLIENCFLSDYIKRSNTFLYTRNYWSRDSNIELGPFPIVVAGVFYPCFKIRHKNFYTATFSYCYSLEKLIEECKKSNYSLAYKTYDNKTLLQDLKEYFERQLKKEELDWLIENKITILHPWLYTKEAKIHEEYMVDGFHLKDFNFQSRLDPFQTNQLISMWVGGVLASSGNPMVKISDNKIKLEKAGFDNKISFRKQKSQS